MAVITILSSSHFAKEMLDIKAELIKLRHTPLIHPYYEEIVAGRMDDIWHRVKREHAGVKKEFNLIRFYNNLIEISDGVIVLNYEKNGKPNYIGGNALMEMGFAHHHKKKIFLINPIPDYLSYKDEIEAMEPIILNGDLSKIS